MPATVDSYIWIFHIDGFGYEQFYINDIKLVITTLLTVLVNTKHKMVCCFPNFVTRMAHKSLTPFLNERIKRKIVFLDEITQEAFENVGVRLLNWP